MPEIERRDQAALPLATAYNILNGNRAAEPPPLAPVVETLTDDEISALAGADDTPTSVTPESLLTSTETRLQDIDAQILGVYEMINGRRVRSDALTNDMKNLQILQTAMEAKGKDGDDRIKLQNLTVTLPDGSSQDAISFIREHQLEGALGIQPPIDGLKISSSQIESGVDTLRSSQSQLNSRTEMDMMHLQQLVNQRGQVIELATKLLDAMHQSEKAILANLGR